MSTQNDRAVLNSIFNPLLPTSDILYQDIPAELVDGKLILIFKMLYRHIC